MIRIRRLDTSQWPFQRNDFSETISLDGRFQKAFAQLLGLVDVWPERRRIGQCASSISAHLLAYV